MDDFSHVFRSAESFFTIPHDVLYSGIVIRAFAAVMGYVVALRNNEMYRVFKKPIRLMVIGSSIQFFGGIFDFLWHSMYGFSIYANPLPIKYEPGHLFLAGGSVLNAIGTFIALSILVKNKLKLKKFIFALLIISLGALWITVIFLIYGAAIPLASLSNDPNIRNTNPLISLIIVLVVIPLTTSSIFVLVILKYSIMPRSYKNS